MEKKNKHKSVLLQEVISYLDPKPGETFIDATIGFGGHSTEILKSISPNGKLLGIDQDLEELDWLGANTAQKYTNLVLAKGNFSQIKKIAENEGFDKVDGILADIGVSSVQLDKCERGFSLKNDGPLDMRMDKDRELTAAEVVNTYSEHDLTDIFSKYGEERLSKTVAREIVTRRAQRPFTSTLEFAGLVDSIYDKRGLKGLKVHPATRVFQALRIEVNDELGSLQKFLPQSLDLLAQKGRLAVITFHSLEDRIVKDFFQKEAKGCICPPEYPVCKCGHDVKVKILAKKPILPSNEEIKDNPRSRSAKLRVIEKI